ncbi:hypothetical protein SAMN04244572_04198 [Azotobacter beijerinckii]|uniref:Uncharacterized protein n=1 Tax=Azotobacter beijerinckii TaxID=170623 RepID=A0A1H6W166_9GAMM|nr:hypothetical protein [Azotobacter beijerinckii]SEJ09626.1 hypothetical protein SAMN04244579_03101 [Azotobacter beijerinckii]SEJ48772.1 hypothetical protein SAMN04244572_04198 [Azotobacter beijerinckii]
MNDSKSGLRPAPASFGLKKAIAHPIQLAPRHLALIRTAQQALHRATTGGCSPEDRAAWQTAAERLSMTLVAYLEAVEGGRQ